MPLGSSPVSALPQLCGWQGGVGAAKSSLGWQPRLTSEVFMGQFVLPKDDEVQRAWNWLADTLAWY